MNTEKHARYEAEFEPVAHPVDQPPAAAERLAEAAEYAAFQLGQINRKLDRLIGAVERLAGSQPDPRPFSQIKAAHQAKPKR